MLERRSRMPLPSVVRERLRSAELVNRDCTSATMQGQIGMILPRAIDFKEHIQEARKGNKGQGGS